MSKANTICHFQLCNDRKYSNVHKRGSKAHFSQAEKAEEKANEILNKKMGWSKNIWPNIMWNCMFSCCITANVVYFLCVFLLVLMEFYYKWSQPVKQNEQRKLQGVCLCVCVSTCICTTNVFIFVCCLVEAFQTDYNAFSSGV